MSDRLVLVQISLAALQNVLFATATGVVVCGVMGQHAGLLEQVKLLVWRGLLITLLTLTALAYLWLEAAAMSGSPLHNAGTAVGAVLTRSHFGKAWSLEVAGALLAALSCLLKERGFAVYAAAVLLWIAGKTATSHAADSGDFSLRESAHAMHLLATALWAGSVLVSAVLLRGSLWSSGAAARQRAKFCYTLSQLATAALVAALVTGVCGVLHVKAQSGSQVLYGGWGRLLAVKLTFVILTICLGGYNRIMMLPKLRKNAEQDGFASRAAQRRFNWVLSVEAVVMLAVFVVSAVLGHTAPMVG